jgi:endonuclease YncB( thermonuclease family)
MSLSRRLLLSLSLLAGLSACAQPSRDGRRYDRERVTQALADLDRSALVLGEFPLTKVIDGDTIRVDGLDQSHRLIGLDTEETFKTERDRRAFENGWESYLVKAQAKTRSPVKIPTPLGEDAKTFAKAFFKGVRYVQLERDHPKEVRDRFGRFLTYVFVEKDGKRLNYNVECVRAGMSPYFMKYGYSRRFHQELIDAQDEARAAGRGIWDPSKMHYRDYDARLRWWTYRAEAVQAFERESEGKDDHIILTHYDAPQRLQALLGREVVLFGAVAEIRQNATGPTKVMLARRQGEDFSVIFFDKDVFEATGIPNARGEFIKVRGVVSSWHNKYKKRDELQIQVELAGQVTLTPTHKPGYAPIGLTVDAPPEQPAPSAPEPAPELTEAPEPPPSPEPLPSPAPLL